MNRNAVIGIVSLLSATCMTALPAAAAESCAELYGKAQAAEKNLRALEIVFQKAQATTDCTPDFRRSLGRKVAVAIATVVDQAVKNGGKLEDFKGELKDSLNYHRLWEVLATLGDLAAKEKDHPNASLRYQEALEAIDDKLMTKRAPDERTIRTIVKKAEDARLLSASYVPVPKTRGVPQGLGAPQIRGIKIKKIAVPITFNFGETSFTHKGQAAASDLLSYLKAQGSPKITLIGHTDPVGSASYNYILSERRAFAVKDYLASSGYHGHIQVIGKGEDHPYQPADSSRYSIEELHQMSRRVELVR